MIYKLLTNKETKLLGKTLQKFKVCFPGHSNITKNFEASIPKDSSEICYAIGFEEEDIKIVYAVHRELKITRGLKAVYHTQKLVGEVLEQEELKFQKWMVQQLQTYKIVTLGTSPSQVMKPYQKYMEIAIQPSL